MIGTRDARFRPLVLPSSGPAGVSLAPRISRGQDKICSHDVGAGGGRRMRPESGSGWPLVGRDDEVRQALAALEDDAEFQGVALFGDSGVAKSTLARALATTVKSGGRTVRYVLGTQTGFAMPLGAFYRSVTVDAGGRPPASGGAAHRARGQDENMTA